ncbi:MAG: alanine racemase, partial [Planctomycetota bacterium]
EGARNIFVAYPPLGPLADRIAAAVSQDAGLRILAQVSRIEHAGFLADAAGRYDVDLDYLIDIDVGDHRTGLPPPEAGALLKAIQGDSRFSRLHCEGLHAYDGHNHSSSPQERKECGYESMESLVKVLGELEGAGNRMRRLVVGGTPGSLPCLEALAARDDIEADVEISPGTYIYWDTRYDELMPGRFRLAALILARVMDRPTPRRITLDLGHKRWGIDQGPVHLFSSPGLEVVKVSEEHTVLEHDGNSTLRIGDPVLIAPRHVCSTVNLWEEFHLVTANGQLQSEPLAVTARNR